MTSFRHFQKKSLKVLKKKNRNEFIWIFIQKKTGKIKKLIQIKSLFKNFLNLRKIQTKNYFYPIRITNRLKRKKFFSSNQKAVCCFSKFRQMNHKFNSNFISEKGKIEEKFTIFFRLLWLRTLLSSKNLRFEYLNIFKLKSVNIRPNFLFFDNEGSWRFSIFPRNVLRKNIKKQYLFLIFWILLYLKT